jgi:hypothetical protein
MATTMATTPTPPQTAAPPPSRDILHGQITNLAPPNQQAAVSRALEQLSQHLDLINAATGQNFVLAVAAYSPKLFPQLMTKAGAVNQLANDAAQKAALQANGYA